MACLANDLRELGQPVVAGFSTHPDWDHVLWHAEFGEAPRYGTARCAASMRDLLSNADWKARVAEALPPEIAEEIPLDLFGLITGLPAGTAQIPWDGPRVRIIEHPAHAPGHAALLIEERGVLVAGDMLSDVLIPMLDLDAPLTRSRTTSSGCGCSRAWRTTLMSSSPVTGPSAELIRYAHGSTRTARTCKPCVTADVPDDPRIGPSAKPGWDWVQRRARMGNSSASPKEASATGRPASDPAGDKTTLPDLTQGAPPSAPDDRQGRRPVRTASRGAHILGLEQQGARTLDGRDQFDSALMPSHRLADNDTIHP